MTHITMKDDLDQILWELLTYFKAYLFITPQYKNVKTKPFSDLSLKACYKIAGHNVMKFIFTACNMFRRIINSLWYHFF
ncbi:hypothetical protein SAMN05880574_1247 [Chryseobacterium sp. RU37D]|nr:hypothetical protein SAMN05880574_1247 [Chryseobacterium sp. RU37D]